MTDKTDSSRIEKFLSNTSSHAEAEEVAHYLENNQEALDKIVLTEDLQDTDLISAPYDAKQKVLKGIFSTSKTKIISLKRWLVAASIIGAVALAAYWFAPKKSPKEIALVEKIIKNNTTALLSFTLPDSSKLALQPGAEIVFKPDFATNRNVDVAKGNVYFRVAKDKVHPFRVVANGISTTDIGTEFWVQNFTNNTLDISLVEGEIFIHSVDDLFKMDTVFLVPGQTCSINKNTGKVSISVNGESKLRPKTNLPKHAQKIANAQNTIVWTNREIRFYNASLQHVFDKLEHRYNVKIIVQDSSILQATMTGKMFYNDSLNVLIKSICDLNKLSYEMRNDSIFLKK